MLPNLPTCRSGPGVSGITVPKPAEFQEPQLQLHDDVLCGGAPPGHGRRMLGVAHRMAGGGGAVWWVIVEYVFTAHACGMRPPWRPAWEQWRVGQFGIHPRPSTVSGVPMHQIDTALGLVRASFWHTYTPHPQPFQPCPQIRAPSPFCGAFAPRAALQSLLRPEPLL